MTFSVSDSVLRVVSLSKSQDNTQKKKWLRYLIYLGVALTLLVCACLLWYAIYQMVEETKTETNKWYSNKSCANLGKCQKKGFSTIPLVIISFDGFRRDYLDKPDWTPWLHKMAECGVTAEKVYPVYPSKTFVNHYSQVTGLLPTFHGIIDNWFWDERINGSSGESMKNTANKAYYKGIPIWEHYMNIGGKANCFFWPGTNHHPCSVNKAPYNKDIPFKERINQVREWLNLPEGERPGFVTIYFDEPDTAGHGNGEKEFLNSKMLRTKVKEMDQLLHDFLQALHEDGILNCINIVILSDHGLVSIAEHINITQLIPNAKNWGGGTVGRVYTNFSDQFLAEHAANCKEGTKKFLVTTDQNRPARLHHSGTPSIGNLVLEGRLAVDFEVTHKLTNGNHGYDFLYDQMHTIFFARGPAFKPGVVLPPFQNMEYFNLFLELLGMDTSRYPNNGTLGIFDPALKSPLHRSEKNIPEIQKCETSTVVPSCCSHTSDCDHKVPNIFGSHLADCVNDQTCGKKIFSRQSKVIGVMETLNNERKECYCEGNFFLSFDSTVSFQSNITGSFVQTALKALGELQKKLLERVGMVYMLSGTAVDHNYDVVADLDQNLQATHFYRLLVYCKDSNYTQSETICNNKDQLATVSFILPLIETDPNCLDSDELLLYYSAQLKDVESVSGLQLKLPGYSAHQSAVLATSFEKFTI